MAINVSVVRIRFRGVKKPHYMAYQWCPVTGDLLGYDERIHEDKATAESVAQDWAIANGDTFSKRGSR